MNTRPKVIAFEGTAFPSIGYYPRGFMDQLRTSAGADYVPGPDALNLVVKLVLESGRAKVRQFLSVTRPGPIFLAGWSRGAAAAIHLSKELGDGVVTGKSVEVEALFLFDAVDRSRKLKTEVVPRTVKNCYHAYRDPNVHSWDGFGNTGMKWEGHPEYAPKMFFATHSAFGGMPGDRPITGKFDHSALDPNLGRVNYYRGTTISSLEDFQASTKVGRWMSDQMRNHGILIDLKPIRPAICEGPEAEPLYMEKDTSDYGID